MVPATTKDLSRATAVTTKHHENVAVINSNKFIHGKLYFSILLVYDLGQVIDPPNNFSYTHTLKHLLELAG